MAVEDVGIRIKAQLGMDTAPAEQAARTFQVQLAEELRHLEGTVNLGPLLQFDQQAVERAKYALQEIQRSAEQAWAAMRIQATPAAPTGVEQAMARARDLLGRSLTPVEELAARTRPGAGASSRDIGEARAALVGGGSYLQREREHNELLREQGVAYADLAQHVHVLELALEEMHGKERKAGEQILQQLKDRRDMQLALAEGLAKTVAAGRATEAAHALQQGDMPGHGVGRSAALAAMLAQMRQMPAMGFGQVMGGAAAVGAGGALWRLLAGIPVVGWGLTAAAAITGGAHLVERSLSGMARKSEDIELAHLQTARRTGLGDVRGLFEPTRGVLRQDLVDLGYTGEDLAKMGAAYAIPGRGFAGAVTAQARFARMFGFSGEEVSAVGRRATQLGLAEPGQQEQFWLRMTDAIHRGMRQGVDASETMRSLLAFAEQGADRLGVVSDAYAQNLEALHGVLGRGGRVFAGERGAQNVSTLLDAFTTPQGTAQKMVMMAALMRAYGGRLPTAAQVGYRGEEAAVYGGLFPLQQGEAALMKLRENPAELARVVREAPKIAGLSQAQLLAEMLPNVPIAKIIEMAAAEGRAAKLPGSAPVDALAKSLEEAKGTPETTRTGSMPTPTVSPVERIRALEDAGKEAASSIVQMSDAARATRLQLSSLERAAAQAARDLQELIDDSLATKGPLDTAERLAEHTPGLGGLGLRAARKLLEQLRARPGHEPQSQSGAGREDSWLNRMLEQGDAERVMKDRALQHERAAEFEAARKSLEQRQQEFGEISQGIREHYGEPGHAIPQSFRGTAPGHAAAQQVSIRIEAGGSIHLTGLAESAALPAEQLVPVIVHLIEQRLGRPTPVGQTRKPLLSPLTAV